MLHRLSFRGKVFLSQLVLFIVYVLVSIPLMHHTVGRIVDSTLLGNVKNIITHLQQAKDEKEMISFLQSQELNVFVRASLLNSKGALLYDASLSHVLGDNYKPLNYAEHPEVQEALKKGVGYSEDYSEIFNQKFAYVAKSFNFQGSTYVLRTEIPFGFIDGLTKQVEWGFILFGIGILLCFGLLTQAIFYRLTRPIQKIIDSIKGSGQEPIPAIVLDPSFSTTDDFRQLANTLNTLSERVRSQIKHTLDERNEKEAILESLGEGVIAFDVSMNVTYVNFIGSKMLGIPKRHLVNRQLPIMQNPNTALLLERCRDLIKACQDTQSVLTDSVLLGDTKKVYLDLIAAPKTQGNGAIIVLQDKSSQYKVLEMGKDFVANASHELRTPITIIKGFAETLHDLPELSPEMLSDITEKIVRNCERMEMLVKNLLTLADIENLPMTRLRETDIVSLVESCRHHLLSVHSGTVVNIYKNKEEITAPADPDLLELAIINILQNAVKYSPPPAKITVNIDQVAEEVKITITDKGIGIPASDIDHIFERFYTVNKAHSRRLGGAGLGLSIVKTIIEKHDGTITATSVLGQGTTFIITLPAFQEHND